jgi:Low psii accumulation1 / Rep27
MMRYLRLVVCFVVTLNVDSVAAFTGCSEISKRAKAKGVQIDQNGHGWVIPSTMTTLKRPYRNRQLSLTQLQESPNKKKGGLDESVRTKLVSESIAPWRTLRLFLYFSLGSGALVGGLITLTGFAALVSGAKEGDINTEVSIPEDVSI